MHMIRHLCGQHLSRGSGAQGAYFHAVPVTGAGVRHVEVQACPRCGEPLCDTDCTDRSGVPLAVNNPSDWSLTRRAALAGLAQAGYTLRYDGALWRIRANDRDYDTASSDNLDAVIELATAIATHC